MQKNKKKKKKQKKHWYSGFKSFLCNLHILFHLCSASFSTEEQQQQ